MLRWVANYYKIPMTDPRILDLTEEQLMLEFAFLKKEKPEFFKGEHYSDPNYEEWERKVLAEDSKLTRGTVKRATPVKQLNLNDSDEWEPV